MTSHLRSERVLAAARLAFASRLGRILAGVRAARLVVGLRQNEPLPHRSKGVVGRQGRSGRGRRLCCAEVLAVCAGGPTETLRGPPFGRGTGVTLMGRGSSACLGRCGAHVRRKTAAVPSRWANGRGPAEGSMSADAGCAGNGDIRRRCESSFRRVQANGFGLVRPIRESDAGSLPGPTEHPMAVPPCVSAASDDEHHAGRLQIPRGSVFDPRGLLGLPAVMRQGITLLDH
jgi:hypothetical protein